MYEVCMQFCPKTTVEMKQNVIGKGSFTHDFRSIDGLYITNEKTGERLSR